MNELEAEEIAIDITKKLIERAHLAGNLDAIIDIKGEPEVVYQDYDDLNDEYEINTIVNIVPDSDLDVTNDGVLITRFLFKEFDSADPDIEALLEFNDKDNKIVKIEDDF